MHTLEKRLNLRRLNITPPPASLAWQAENTTPQPASLAWQAENTTPLPASLAWQAEKHWPGSDINSTVNALQQCTCT